MIALIDQAYSSNCTYLGPDCHPTVVPKDSSIPKETLGSQHGISKNDALLLNKMYQCHRFADCIDKFIDCGINARLDAAFGLFNHTFCRQNFHDCKLSCNACILNFSNFSLVNFRVFPPQRLKKIFFRCFALVVVFFPIY